MSVVFPSPWERRKQGGGLCSLEIRFRLTEHRVRGDRLRCKILDERKLDSPMRLLAEEGR